MEDDMTGLFTKTAPLTLPCPSCGRSLLDGVCSMIDCNRAVYGVCELDLAHTVERHPEFHRGEIPEDIDPLEDDATSPCPFARGAAGWVLFEHTLKESCPTVKAYRDTLKYATWCVRTRLAEMEARA